LAEEAGTDNMECFNEVDPVCGMVLNSCEVVETSVFESKTYGFCSKQCKDMFEENPKKYSESPAVGKGVPAPMEHYEDPVVPEVKPPPMEPPL
jgi:YHS domain-containing protein